MPKVNPNYDPNQQDNNYIVIINGFTLNPATTETLQVTSNAVQDSAGRTYIYIEYDFRFRTVIFSPAGTTTNDQMDLIRRRLNSPGGYFTYRDRGFGEFDINTNRRQKDAKWGPWPMVTSWKPWGDGNAAEVEITVKVRIPECNAARFENAVMEFNFRVDYEVADGYTTRKMTGHLVIPQTRRNQAVRQFARSADEYRDKIRPRTPNGFRPLPMSFTLSEDKCRLDFRFADEEMEGIPPPGVLRVEAEMDGGNQAEHNHLQQVYTINATYDLAKGTDARVAAEHFRQLVADRKARLQIGLPIGQGALGAAVAGAALVGRLGGAGDKGGANMIDVHRRVREKIYGRPRKASFTVVFTHVRRIQDIMPAAFFTPVPGSDYNKWRASMKDVLFNTRGQEGLKFDPQSDLIIDLCFRDPQADPKLDIAKRLKFQPLPFNRLGQAKQKAHDGFVYYENNFTFTRVDSNYIHKPLPAPPATFDEWHDLIKERKRAERDLLNEMIEDYGDALRGGTLGQSGNYYVRERNRPYVNIRCRSTYYLIHTGRAMRVGQAIPEPRVLAVGPYPCVPANQDGDGMTTQVIPGNVANIFKSRWKLRYAIGASMDVPIGTDNPLFDEREGEQLNMPIVMVKTDLGRQLGNALLPPQVAPPRRF